MKPTLAIKALFRAPVKTLATFLLLGAVSFALFSRVGEYAVSAREFERAAGRCRGIGLVEAGPPPEIDIGGAEFLLPLWERDLPVNKDGTGEGSHYQALSPEAMAALDALPYVADTSVRYMTAGISKEHIRLDDRHSYYNYTQRLVFEATLNSWGLDTFWYEGTSAKLFDTGYAKTSPWTWSGSADGPYRALNMSATGYFSDIRILSENPWDMLEAPRSAMLHNKSLAQDDGIHTWRCSHIDTEQLPDKNPDIVCRQLYDYPLTFSFHIRDLYDPDTMPSLDLGSLADYYDFRYGTGELPLIAGFASSDARLDGSNRVGGYTVPISYETLKGLKPGARYLVVMRYDANHYHRYGSLSSCMVGDIVSEEWWDSLVSLDGQPENYLETEEFSGLRELIEITDSDIHTFDIVYCENMADIFRFNEEKMAVVKGRALTPADEGAEVCVVSDIFAGENGLNIGDTLSLGLCDKLFEQHAGLGAVAGTRDRYSAPVKDVSLEIVGIYAERENERQLAFVPFQSYSSSTVFVPLSLLPASADTAGAPVKPGAFSLVVNARDIEAFQKESAPMIKELGLTLTFSEGGWREIEGEFRQTQRIALTSISILLAAMLAAVTLVVFLFVGQKKKEYAIMRATGCGKRRAGKALFLPLFVLSAAAVAAGSGAGWWNTARSAGDSIPLPAALGCIIGVLLFLCAAAWFGLWRVGRLPPLALLQAGRARRGKGKKAVDPGQAVALGAIQWSEIPPVPEKRNRQAFSHIARYIARGARRAFVKSILTVAAAALLFGAAGQFAAVRESTRALLEAMPVKATFTGLIDLQTVGDLEKDGLLKDPYYEAAGQPVRINGMLFSLGAASDADRFFGGPSGIEWAGGYGPESLNSDDFVCVLSDEAMQALGLELGDTFFIDVFFSVYTAPYFDPFTVIGRMPADKSIETDVLIPPGRPYQLIYAGNIYYLKYTGRPPRQGMLAVYSLVEYTLADNQTAAEFRESAKAQIFPFIKFVMNTDEFDKIQNNLEMLELLFPVVISFLALISGLLPGLMLLQAAREAALLRILGTTKHRTRAMLLGGQGLLCLLGLALGLLAVFLYNGAGLTGRISGPLGLCAALNGGCCAAMILICGISVTRRKILELLQSKE